MCYCNHPLHPPTEPLLLGCMSVECARWTHPMGYCLLPPLANPLDMQPSCFCPGQAWVSLCGLWTTHRQAPHMCVIVPIFYSQHIIFTFIIIFLFMAPRIQNDSKINLLWHKVGNGMWCIDMNLYSSSGCHSSVEYVFSRQYKIRHFRATCLLPADLPSVQ